MGKVKKVHPYGYDSGLVKALILDEDLALSYNFNL